jgi:hypothetical protein
MAAGTDGGYLSSSGPPTLRTPASGSGPEPSRPDRIANAISLSGLTRRRSARARRNPDRRVSADRDAAPLIVGYSSLCGPADARGSENSWQLHRAKSSSHFVSETQ